MHGYILYTINIPAKTWRWRTHERQYLYLDSL